MWRCWVVYKKSAVVIPILKRTPRYSSNNEFPK